MSVEQSANTSLCSNMDRISELPADIRNHILSLLSTRESILTSTLSKTWRYYWLSIPCLDLGRDFFLQKWNLDSASYQLACKQIPNPEDAMRFLEFIDRAVISKRPTIQKLHLYIPPIDGLNSRIASYLDMLIVDELVIDVIGHYSISKLSRLCYIPKCVLSCNFINKLFIKGCNLSGISIGEINLPALRELSVNFVVMDQQTAENLVASCTGVEKLCFNDCKGFHSLQITGQPNLYHLEQKSNSGLEILEINTTNLRSLCYSPHSFTRCKLVLGSSCHTLTHIELSDCSIEDGLDFSFCRRISDLRLLHCRFGNKWLDRHLSQLLNLEVLEISCDSTPTHLMITSAHLRSLTICSKRELEQVQLNCPSMEDFIYCTHGNIISLSSETTLAPTSVTLQLRSISNGDSTWNFKLIELLRQLRKSKYLSIETTVTENVIIPRPLRLRSQSPLCEFEQLKLFPEYSVSCLDVTRSIDSFLWLCPRLKTLHILDTRLRPCPPSYRARCNKTLLIMLLKDPLVQSLPIQAIVFWMLTYAVILVLFKLDYNEPTELPQTCCGCYPSLPVECWRHSLRKYEIMVQQGFEDDNGSLRNFLDSAVAKI